MSVVTTLTWSCIQLQAFLESEDVTEEEKVDLVQKHLVSVEELIREPFPCFETGKYIFLTSTICYINRQHFKVGSGLM